MDWNFNFCTKKKNRFDYCYNKCNKTCPTISNITHKFIINPLHLLIWAIQNKFMKCDKLPTKCSFLFCKKYCTLIGECGVYKNLKRCDDLLKSAKEVSLKKNDDSTHNITIKMDIYIDGVLTPTEFYYPRVKINELDVDILNSIK